jgi:hypothetical protein
MEANHAGNSAGNQGAEGQDVEPSRCRECARISCDFYVPQKHAICFARG